MKISKIYLKIAILLPLMLGAQNKNTKANVYYDKLPNITIDKIVQYENPYTTLYNKPTDLVYKPNWYWAYCSGSYPLAFDNYAKQAGQFRTLDNPVSEEEASEYDKKFRTFKPEQFRTPFVYYYGEIYFTDKKTKKKYLMTLAYRMNKEYKNLDLSRLDTLAFKKPKPLQKGKKPSDMEPNEIITHLPTTSEFYALEDNIYKLGNVSNIYDNVLRQGDHDLFFKGDGMDQFYVMLRRAPNYIRSRVVNGERIFETVKQTPKGIVVIGKKRNKLDEN